MSKRTFIVTLALCTQAFLAEGGDKVHWAFQPIVNPGIPELEHGVSKPVRNPIDALVFARLKKEGLEPSPEAQPQVLLRRLHLDLTGLLPTTQDIAAFKQEWGKDPESAYAKKVEELLGSPHFGERWARQWLDLARYADSDGYLGDTMRKWAWIYRDWVIDAINRDQPYDQFSIEQLAGDLLPNASQSQKIASGFHRNNLNNTEAGADRELNRTKQVVDRVATTGTTWLGLTVACAECHDHKHDPISQKEFYQLYAFFNNTNDVEISIRLDEEWTAYEAKRKKWESELVELERAMVNDAPGEVTVTTQNNWEILTPDKVEAAGTDLKIQPDKSILASGKVPSTVSYFVETAVNKEQTITGLRLEVFGNFGEGREPGKTVGRGKDGEFLLSMFFPDLIVDGKSKRLKLTSAKADHFDEGSDSAVSKTIESNNEGWKIATQTYQSHSIVFQLEEPTTLPAGSRLKFSLGHKSGTGHSIRQFQLSTTSDTGALIPDAPAIDSEYSKRRLPLEKHLANPPTKPDTKAQSLAELGEAERRETFIHIRGEYTRPGEAVTPHTLAVLHPFSSEKPDRLALAQWLFDPKNPLTPRVAANQIWQELFGVGIVSTSDDFGKYGATPTHPDLLDFLAAEYRDNGWSRKALIRQIVTSSTYRQASINHHPERSNELLWRQNSFRLPADAVRDVHLCASGLFSPEIGGPGIRPPLPEFVSAVGRSVQWPLSEGSERYRRGMYIVLKRTVLYPMLTTFDAPDTSASCSRREKTNTPMQALTLLNDPVFFECAEALGRDVFKKHGSQTKAAIQDLFQRCLNRDPDPAELATLDSVHRDFSAASDSAEFAMIATARVVMNLNEFITRD